MRPLEVDKDPQDDEAHAIAITMWKMKYHEMVYLFLSTGAVLEILRQPGKQMQIFLSTNATIRCRPYISNCKDLEYIYLHLHGCLILRQPVEPKHL